MNNKLSASEVFNQLQANCDFVEKSVNKELHKQGRVNLLLFNFTALISILREDFLDTDYDFFMQLVEKLKSEVSNKLNINIEESGNYIGRKMDVYSPFIDKLANREEIASTIASEFYVDKLDMEFVYRLDISLSYLTNLIVKIADSIE